MKRILNVVLFFVVLTVANMYWPQYVETTIPTSILVTLFCSVVGGLIIMGVFCLLAYFVFRNQTLASFVIMFVVTMILSTSINGILLYACTFIFQEFAIHGWVPLLIVALCTNLFSVDLTVNKHKTSTTTTTTGLSRRRYHNYY